METPDFSKGTDYLKEQMDHFMGLLPDNQKHIVNNAIANISKGKTNEEVRKLSEIEINKLKNGN